VVAAAAGASALRALVYLDEVMGYLPPHPRNPTTKWPVLALMKQARAVGVGVMLCTQNPVDLDYKAMSNAATWLVGRLQTRQDRQRVLDGMATAGVDVGDARRRHRCAPPAQLRPPRWGGHTHGAVAPHAGLPARPADPRRAGRA
jgi:hypothetical protein